MQAEKLDEVVGENLRYYRELKGLSQTALAALVGINRVHLNRLEKGRSSASLALLARISEVLGVDPHAFLAERVQKVT